LLFRDEDNPTILDPIIVLFDAFTRLRPSSGKIPKNILFCPDSKL